MKAALEQAINLFFGLSETNVLENLQLFIVVHNKNLYTCQQTNFIENKM